MKSQRFKVELVIVLFSVGTLCSVLAVGARVQASQYTVTNLGTLSGTFNRGGGA